jgi:hypothetical protein
MMRTLFAILRLIGDIKAASKGRYPQRVARRHAHRGLNRVLRKVGL